MIELLAHIIVIRRTGSSIHGAAKFSSIPSDFGPTKEPCERKNGPSYWNSEHENSAASVPEGKRKERKGKLATTAAAAA